MQRIELASTSSAYIFLMVCLLFGLPLLTGYYTVNPSFFTAAVVPFLLFSVFVTVLLLHLSQKVSSLKTATLPLFARTEKTVFVAAMFIRKFNAIPTPVLLALATATVLSYGALRYAVVSTYPFATYESTRMAEIFGTIYVVFLIVTSLAVFPRIVYRSSPTMRRVLEFKKYSIMAVVFAVGFWVVYMLLVNQILIIGYNVPAGVPTPSGTYPHAYVFTLGVEQPFLNAVYLPYVVLQLTSQLDLLLIPFEVVFSIVLALLVSSNVVMANYLISNSGLRCSTKGTALSTSGSILGLTATCPTCLVPTLVSVLFGGITAAEVVYSNLYGVILPPVLSVATLILSLVYLSRTVRSKTNIDRP